MVRLLRSAALSRLLACPKSRGSSWTGEWTLVAVKADRVQQQFSGDVMLYLETRGFKLVEMKMLQAPKKSPC